MTNQRPEEFFGALIGTAKYDRITARLWISLAPKELAMVQQMKTRYKR
jgi:hypothetical protein